MNMTLLLCVVVSGGMLVLLLVGLLDGAFPAQAERSRSIEMPAQLQRRRAALWEVQAYGCHRGAAAGLLVAVACQYVLCAPNELGVAAPDPSSPRTACFFVLGVVVVDLVPSTTTACNILECSSAL